MCIALLTTAHPSYSLILLDNRDEFLNRPTAPATWWPAPNTSTSTSILGGRDLLRPERGTWLGLTSTGRIAVLTNFREEVASPPSAVSRGAIIKDFLGDDSGRGTAAYVADEIRNGRWADVGGFSLLCGRAGQALSVLSNRSAKEGKAVEILGERGVTVGLSNAAFGDRGWKKVEDGERLLSEGVRESQLGNESEDELVRRFLRLLSTDTLPRHENGGGGLESYIGELRNTIFVPALGRKSGATSVTGDARKNQNVEVLNEDSTQAQRQGLGISGMYGTQKQTVVLVDHASRVRFFERTLYDNNSDPVPIGDGDVDITFHIED